MNRWKKFIAPAIGLIILFLAWYGICRLQIFSAKVWGSFWKTLVSGEIFRVPLLILRCGIRETTKTVIIVLASFFPMYLNIVKGFIGCDQKLLEVGNVFGYSRFERFTKIMLPYASADILVGMRIGLGYSWRAIIGAEMVAASFGLGHMILFAQQMSRTDKVIVGILVISLIGYATDCIFGCVIKKMLKGSCKNSWN